MVEHYASGTWNVRRGCEQDFVERWMEFLQWTRTDYPSMLAATLIRDRRVPGHYLSFAEWADEQSRAAWRAAPEFHARLGACRALCEDMGGRRLRPRRDRVTTATAVFTSHTNHDDTRRATMTLQLGDTAPDFHADTTEGRIGFHDWLDGSWAVLFSHPKDFTPVCTTELGYLARIKPEFDRRAVKIIGLSVDHVDKHRDWATDIEQTQGVAPNYPVIGDSDFAVSKLYGMLPASTTGDPATRTPADNQTVRNVFVIGPDRKIKLILVYPMTTGRNFDEVLRVIDSLQLTANHKVATPVNWRQGDDVIIAGAVSNSEAKQIFGTWEEPKPYIRIVPQPV